MLSILARRRITMASTRLSGVVQNFSSTSIDNELYAEEEIPNEGEWAGCSRRFMAPIQISARGDGEFDELVLIYMSFSNCKPIHPYEMYLLSSSSNVTTRCRYLDRSLV
jgi:hypothetical protein